MDALAEMMADKTTYFLAHREALDGTYQLEADADRYRGYVNEYKEILGECFEIAEALYQEKLEELEFMEWVTGNAMTLDGVASTNATALCPLTSDDRLPAYPLQHVIYFDMH